MERRSLRFKPAAKERCAHISYLVSDHTRGITRTRTPALSRSTGFVTYGVVLVRVRVRVRCERVVAESQGTTPRVTKESAEDSELQLWPAEGAESLRLPSWPEAEAGVLTDTD